MMALDHQTDPCRSSAAQLAFIQISFALPRPDTHTESHALDREIARSSVQTESPLRCAAKTFQKRSTRSVIRASVQPQSERARTFSRVKSAKMASLVQFAQVMVMSWVCNCFLVFGIWLGCMTMPLRLLGYFRQPAEEPKVKIFVHEASEDSKDECGATPRDTLLLIHGYPDNEHLWDKTVKACTEKGYRCLVVALPGSNGENVSKALSFQETAELIKEAVDGVTDEAMTVIGHDWGSLYGRIFQTKYASLCKRMILLDVGAMKLRSDIHWSTWYSILSYQSVFALSYWLGRPVGTWLMKLQAKVLFKGDGSISPRCLEDLTCDMAYPYASMFESIAKGKEFAKRDFKTREFETIPHLYVYGSKKAFQFHDSNWLNLVRSTPSGEVASLPCIHWLMHEEADALHRIMVEWLDKSL